MTKEQILLTQLAEECNEVAQRVSKAIRFGLDEVQEGQEKTNEERIVEEFNDLLTVMKVLEENGTIRINPEHQLYYMVKKMAKIEKYLAYSKERGILEEDNQQNKTDEAN